MLTRTVRSEKLDLRLTPSAKRIIADAADSLGRSVTDFVIESALSRAHEALPDRRFFALNSDKWLELQKALDAPARPLPRLKRLFDEPSVFESRDEAEPGE